jgi:hypothetical protein
MQNPLVVKKIAQERYDICKSCDRFNTVTYQCKECMCFMKLKVKLKNSHCPLNKWTWVEENIGDRL